MKAPAPASWRESVVIDRRLILEGETPVAGEQRAEIRGSDVWTGWTFNGTYWTKSGLPPIPMGNWPCRANSPQCNWPQQVFLDGEPLLQVSSGPVRGQFAVSGDTVLLADDPTNRLVEVSTREMWIDGRANDVTIRGLTMRHAANPAQFGALRIGGYPDPADTTKRVQHHRWTVQDSDLYQAHGPNLSMLGGDGHKVLRNDIGWGGQFGVHGHSLTNPLVQENEIHHNNTEGFRWTWSSGGLKVVRTTNFIIEKN